MTPLISFIVSAYNDPAYLHCVLASIKLQKVFHEIIVTDDSTDLRKTKEIKVLCDMFMTKYIKTYGEPGRPGNDYDAAERGVKLAKGDWLCFGSSDGYYVPLFSEVMMNTALRNDADVVYCDCLYDPRISNRAIYTVLETYPEIYWIDKTCIMIKKSVFKGFPGIGGERDGRLMEDCVRRGLKVIKVKGVLVVHN